MTEHVTQASRTSIVASFPIPTITAEPQALRFNSGKPRLSLLPLWIWKEAAKVMEVGAAKYGDDNWQKGMDWTKVYDSMLRHVEAHVSGEDNDQESGVSHMAHVICNAAFLIYYERYRREYDNRQIQPQPHTGNI